MKRLGQSRPLEAGNAAAFWALNAGAHGAVVWEGPRTVAPVKQERRAVFGLAGWGKNWDFILCGKKPVQSLRPPMMLSCLKLVKRLPWLLGGYDAIREQEWKLRVRWVASAVLLARRDGPWWGQWVRG